MRKLTRAPKSKKMFVRYHILLWQAIIDDLKKSMFDTGMTADALKEYIWEQLFDFFPTDSNGRKTGSYCFPCTYRTYGRKCLMDVLACDTTHGTCLDGVWQGFRDSIINKDLQRAILLAEQIRDFPIRED